MKKNLTLSLLLYIVFSIRVSAGWEKLGYGLSQYAQTIYIDSADDKIYVGGAFAFADSIRTSGIAVWDGFHWDSIGGGMIYGQYNFAITKFQNQIYSDGRFVLHNTSNFGGRFNQTNWDSLGNGLDGPIYQFKEVNGVLWVAGRFENAGGNPCNLLATWDGSNWNCLNVPYNNVIEDFLFYNNQLVIGGNFFDSLGNGFALAYYDGSNFDTLGHAIYGGSTAVHSMTIFNGDLYVAGYFSQADGNEGNNIMRWDGNQWHDVGGGTNSEIRCMTIYNGELYVGGIFDYAGGIHTGCLAKWDGAQWYPATPSIIPIGVEDIQFYNNEMYIAGGFRDIDSLTVNFIAKWTGPLSVNENNLLTQINIYPNPSKYILQVRSDKLIINKIKIISILGENIFNMDKYDNNFQIDISFLSSGLYFLLFETKEGNVVRKFLKE